MRLPIWRGTRTHQMMNGKTMSNDKQSSIEWLWEIAYNNRKLTVEDWKQAKAMHKEEIMDARTNGRWSCTEKYGEIRTNIQYYNETFGDKK